MRGSKTCKKTLSPSLLVKLGLLEDSVPSIVTSSLTHMWLIICLHGLRLPPSVHNVLFLLSVSGNVVEWLSIRPHQPGWSRVMHGTKMLRFMREQILVGQRWLPHVVVVFLTEKTEGERQRGLSLERQLFLTSWSTSLVLFKSQKHARPLSHVSLRWQRV